MGETESVGDSAPIEQDHVHPIGGRWERQNQCVVLQLSSKTTYNLLASDGKARVSASFCNYPARSRTRYWRAMGDTVSLVFSLSNAITYHLSVDEGRDK